MDLPVDNGVHDAVTRRSSPFVATSNPHSPSASSDTSTDDGEVGAEEFALDSSSRVPFTAAPFTTGRLNPAVAS